MIRIFKFEQFIKEQVEAERPDGTTFDMNKMWNNNTLKSAIDGVVSSLANATQDNLESISEKLENIYSTNSEERNDLITIYYNVVKAAIGIKASQLRLAAINESFDVNGVDQMPNEIKNIISNFTGA